VSLGTLLGANWDKFSHSISKYLAIGGIIILLIVFAVLLYKNKKEQMKHLLKSLLKKGDEVFNSIRKLKLAIFISALVIIAMCVGIVYFSDMFLDTEQTQFDMTAGYVIGLIFKTSNWKATFEFMAIFTSAWTVGAIGLIMLIIAFLKKIRPVKVLLMFVVIGGGEALGYVLRFIFNKAVLLTVPFDDFEYHAFPSQHALISVVMYGFVSYLIFKITERKRVKTTVIILSIIICLFSGIRMVYLNMQNMSDTLAGYFFGGVWLLVNILIIEVFNMLPEIKDEKEERNLY